MPLGSLIDGVVILAFAALLIGAAVSDARKYLIPNRLCLVILGLYPLHVTFAALAGVPVDWLAGLAVSAVIFAIGIGLFSLGAFGGGDVKLLAAVALWAGPEGTPALLMITGLAGALVAFAVILRRWIQARRTAGSPEAGGLRRLSVPYGVAIASGGLLIAARLLNLASSNWSA